MSSAELQRHPKTKGPIELELSREISTPRHLTESQRAAMESSPAVPEHPLHLCAYCDYNLTGLTARRCPECGQEFVLSDARRRGFEFSEEVEGFRHHQNTERVLMILGVVAGLFGAVWPWWSARPKSTLGRSPGHALVLGAVFEGLVVIGVVLYLRLYLETTWQRTILTIGIVLLALGLLLSLV